MIATLIAPPDNNPRLFHREVRTSYPRTPKYNPHLKIEVHRSRDSLSGRAADIFIALARTGKGTVLTPGCNTPLRMYQILGGRAAAAGVDLTTLLKGERGEFYMGMIDGTEWDLEHPFSFPYYFCQHFLKYLGLPSLCAIPNPDQKRFIIEYAFETLKNIYVPWIPRNAAINEKWTQVEKFNAWLLDKLPIDLIFCGLGPDGHIAFLSAGQEFFLSPATRIPLWPFIRAWKWDASFSNGACVCAKEQENTAREKPKGPEYALTISLGTLLTAKHVVLMAMGHSKAQAVLQLVEADYHPSQFVAQYLRDAGGKVTLLLDQEAASKLSFAS